jgi:hypothetical protein
MIRHISDGVARTELTGGLLQRRDVTTDQCDRRAIGDKPARDGQAYAFRATGDQRNKTAQRSIAGRAIHDSDHLISTAISTDYPWTSLPYQFHITAE